MPIIPLEFVPHFAQRHLESETPRPRKARVDSESVSNYAKSWDLFTFVSRRQSSEMRWAEFVKSSKWWLTLCSLLIDYPPLDHRGSRLKRRAIFNVLTQDLISIISWGGWAVRAPSIKLCQKRRDALDRKSDPDVSQRLLYFATCSKVIVSNEVLMICSDGQFYN